MRTTLDLDDDVLEAAEHLAAERGTTTDEVVSEIVREAFARRLGRPPRLRNAFRNHQGTTTGFSFCPAAAES